MARTRRELRSRRPPSGLDSFGPVIGLAVIGVVLLSAAGLLESVGEEVSAAIFVGAILFVLTVPLVRWLGRRDDDPALEKLLMVGFAAKIAGAVINHAVLLEVYQGTGDADRYYRVGLELAEQFGRGDFDVGKITGTRFAEVLSGGLYTVIPESRLAGFLVMAWLAFLGCVLFTRAFRRALPHADPRPYDLLILFMPTLVFWPSSLGKDAWMLFVLGVACYGFARIFQGQLIGLVWAGLGVWGAAIVRPHMALIVLGSAGIAWLFRPLGQNRLGMAPFVKAGGLILLVLALLVAVDRSEDFFGIERLDQEGTEEVLEETQENTATGGSEFEATRVETIVDLPQAAVTILFRPFLWEASNGQQLVTASEGVILAILLIATRRQLVRLPRDSLRYPYVLYALVFTVAFIVGFSSVGNFGILVRQRSQLFPLLLVLLVRRDRADEQGEEGEREPELSAGRA